jgi:hypothetical protein
VQRRNAVGSAVQHVQLVGELVDDDVVAVAGHLHVVPGNDQRPAFPGFAGEHVGVFMDDAAFILDLPWHDELVGIDDDADPVLIGVQAELEDGQAALGSDRDADFVAQLQAIGGAEFLFGEKTFGQCLQLPLLVSGEYIEKRQRGDDGRPQAVGDEVRLFAAEPVEQFSHFFMVSQMPVKINPMPR